LWHVHRLAHVSDTNEVLTTSLLSTMACTMPHSFCFAVSKPDVKEAVINLVCICRPNRASAEKKKPPRQLATFRSSGVDIESVAAEEGEEMKESESNDDELFRTCHESPQEESVGEEREAVSST